MEKLANVILRGKRKVLNNLHTMTQLISEMSITPPRKMKLVLIIILFLLISMGLKLGLLSMGTRFHGFPKPVLDLATFLQKWSIFRIWIRKIRKSLVIYRNNMGRWVPKSTSTQTIKREHTFTMIMPCLQQDLTI